MTDARREMTYSDLQVRVLENDPTPATEDVAIVAVTVQNTGTVDDTEHVHVVLAAQRDGARPVLVQAGAEQLEVDHSHRVRCTITGTDLAAAIGEQAGEQVGSLRGAYTVSAGASPEDARLSEPLVIG